MIDAIEDGEGAAQEEGERLRFEPAELDAGGLERLGWAVLGYDVTADEVARALAAVPAEGDPAEERRLLELYADVRALDRPHADGLDSGLGSPQEHLYAFLRSLDPEAEGLPERFVAHLQRALAHYGVESLERTEALEHASYRLFLARRRAGTTRESVRGILASRLERGEPLDDAYRAVLDRLETALAPREPALAELAREVRWRCCDAPALATAREATYEEMAGHLAALAEAGDAAEREAHLVRAGRLPAAPGAAARPGLGRRRPARGGDDAPLLPDPPARGHARGAARRRAVRALVLRARRPPPPRRRHARRSGRAARGAARARGARPHDPRRRARPRRRLRAARGARRPRRAARRGGSPRRGRARRVRALRRGGPSTCAPMRATATADSPRTRPSAACTR